MNEASSIGPQVGIQHGIGRITSKTHVTMETAQPIESSAANDPTQALKTIEFQMEEADHAFALMMEIREKIENQYKELTLPENVE